MGGVARLSALPALLVALLAATALPAARASRPGGGAAGQAAASAPAVSSAGDDCGSYSSCSECPAGCVWADTFNIAGFRCVSEDDVPKGSAYIINNPTDCDCAGSANQKDCATCIDNAGCGFCDDGIFQGFCMSDNDANAAVCTASGQRKWVPFTGTCP